MEQFKKDQRGKNTLHAKFDVLNGNEVVSDNDYNHFQVRTYQFINKAHRHTINLCKVDVSRGTKCSSIMAWF